mgnify:CR=1 FL=1
MIEPLKDEFLGGVNQLRKEEVIKESIILFQLNLSLFVGQAFRSAMPRLKPCPTRYNLFAPSNN